MGSGDNDDGLAKKSDVVNNPNNLDNAISGSGNGLSSQNGEVQMPATTDPKYRFWKSENSVIIAWLLSNMESTIKKPFMFLPTAKEVWEAVKETYSNIQNSSQIFDLKSRLWHTKQGDRDHENDRVFMFLVGLNKRLDEVRGRILGKIPLSSLREAFSEVRREEARQGVMMGKSPSVGEVESSALVTKNEDGKSAGRNHGANIANVQGTHVIHVGSSMENL
ncbi:uncharacterized protein [Cicer arietinum]|uniref:uncharacterized protein n=1 Tax=Cicer arietinum TaxID=3827 RepID=UPI003CC515AD